MFYFNLVEEMPRDEKHRMRGGVSLYTHQDQLQRITPISITPAPPNSQGPRTAENRWNKN